MIFKLRFDTGFDHVHVAVYAGPDKDHLERRGDLILEPDEWPDFCAIFLCADSEMGGLTRPEDLHGAQHGAPEILIERAVAPATGEAQS